MNGLLKYRDGKLEVEEEWLIFVIQSIPAQLRIDVPVDCNIWHSLVRPYRK
jgi:hypothetical protein